VSKPVIVTTSWDDGHPRDLRLAEMLARTGLRATFYVPLVGEAGRPVLRPEALTSLVARGFEIGAHTASHQLLPGLNDKKLLHEILTSKVVLEEWLGTEVPMFCYPRGRYDARVLDSVRQSQFRGARTTRMLAQTLRFKRFEMPTSLQAYPHRPHHYLRNLTRRRDLTGIGRYFRRYVQCKSWVELGKQMFDEALSQGGVWHLFGHSWELEVLGLWDQLQEIFEYVSKRPGVIYATNSQLLDLATECTSPITEAA
jgi:peptidoglycan/xylan/chitin deacetylase (PgdA/CDA1 family)